MHQVQINTRLIEIYFGRWRGEMTEERENTMDEQILLLQPEHSYLGRSRVVHLVVCENQKGNEAMEKVMIHPLPVSFSTDDESFGELVLSNSEAHLWPAAFPKFQLVLLRSS